MINNSQSSWRELFAGELQGALVICALHAYEFSFGWLVRERLVAQSEADRISAALESARNRDISIAYKLYKSRFDWVGGESARDLRGTLQAIFFGLRDNPAAATGSGEVENLNAKGY